MLNIVIFGPPGAGKGTQASLVAKKYNLRHLSSGDLLRLERENGELGDKIKKYQDSGQLVPDQLIIKLIKAAVLKKSSTAGIVFDGYPRNIKQASSLKKLFQEKREEIDVVINLKLSAEKAAQRILLRGQTSGRSDDNKKVILNRFRVYKSQTAPLLEYYQNQGKIVNIDGSLDVETVFNKIQSAITSLDTVNKKPHI